jgi:hypothetical protein
MRKIAKKNKRKIEKNKRKIWKNIRKINWEE